MRSMVSYSKAVMERAMEVQEVILRAMAKRMTWWQAAEIIGISEHNPDPEVAVDRGAKSHLPGLRAVYKCARIENILCLGQPSPLDPCGIDNIDRESSQASSPDIVPVGFDGVWNERQKIRRACLFRHDACSLSSRDASGVTEFVKLTSAEVLAQRFCSESIIPRIEQSLVLAPWHRLARLPDVGSSFGHS